MAVSRLGADSALKSCRRHDGDQPLVERSSTAAPDDITKHHASQRDAGPRMLLDGQAGAFAGIPSGCRPCFQQIPVVSLALNHRIKASMPPASVP